MGSFEPKNIQEKLLEEKIELTTWEYVRGRKYDPAYDTYEPASLTLISTSTEILSLSEIYNKFKNNATEIAVTGVIGKRNSKKVTSYQEIFSGFGAGLLAQLENKNQPIPIRYETRQREHYEIYFIIEPSSEMLWLRLGRKK